MRVVQNVLGICPHLLSLNHLLINLCILQTTNLFSETHSYNLITFKHTIPDEIFSYLAMLQIMFSDFEHWRKIVKYSVWYSWQNTTCKWCVPEQKIILQQHS